MQLTPEERRHLPLAVLLIGVGVTIPLLAPDAVVRVLYLVLGFEVMIGVIVAAIWHHSQEQFTLLARIPTSGEMSGGIIFGLAFLFTVAAWDVRWVASRHLGWNIVVSVAALIGLYFYFHIVRIWWEDLHK